MVYLPVGQTWMSLLAVQGYVPGLHPRSSVP